MILTTYGKNYKTPIVYGKNIKPGLRSISF